MKACPPQVEDQGGEGKQQQAVHLPAALGSETRSAVFLWAERL